MKTNVSSALKEDSREALRNAFLEGQELTEASITPLPADASLRRYFRLPDMLLMDAPPGHENTVSFHVMADLLKGAGLNVPHIYAANHAQGFLLIEDFGELTFRKAIERGIPESLLYGEVIQALVHLHRKVTGKNNDSFDSKKYIPLSDVIPTKAGIQTPVEIEMDCDVAPLLTMTNLEHTIPPYDLNLFLTEAELFTNWYDLSLSPQAKEDFRALWCEAYHQQPSVPHSIVMRDVMVDNLLWIPTQTDFKRCGFIDFQDGVWGPITYDLVSLLEDARRDIPPPFGQEMIKHYLQAFPELDTQDFWASYNLWGAQRCTKILGIFSRLAKRDGKPQYLTHLPRVKRIIERNLMHPSLKALQQWFQAVGL